MRIFVDTGVWVALADGSDQYHKRVRVLMDSLKGKSVQLVSSDYVLDETLTLVRFRGGHRKAVELGKSLLKSSVLRIVNVDTGIWKQAWRIFERYSDQSWSFTDCTSFAVMDSMRIHRAFALDKNFKQYGKEVQP